MTKPKVSHATSVLASRADLVYRVDGQSGSEHYWVYVLVDKPKLDAFLKEMATGIIYVQDFGRILAWGSGRDVPEACKQDIKNTYNFELIA